MVGDRGRRWKERNHQGGTGPDWVKRWVYDRGTLMIASNRHPNRVFPASSMAGQRASQSQNDPPSDCVLRIVEEVMVVAELEAEVVGDRGRRW